MNEAGAGRRVAILEAAATIFLRYGFKKTSMDDVARAVGISRQALYLHFESKEALFRAMVTHTIEAMHARARAALARENIGIEARLLGAFEELHGAVIGVEHLGELIETATTLLGPAFREAEGAVASDMTRALRLAGVAAQWKGAGVSAKALAEHLLATSDGIKRTAKTPGEYAERMRIAVRIVCSGMPHGIVSRQRR